MSWLKGSIWKSPSMAMSHAPLGDAGITVKPPLLLPHNDRLPYWPLEGVVSSVPSANRKLYPLPGTYQPVTVVL